MTTGAKIKEGVTHLRIEVTGARGSGKSVLIERVLRAAAAAMGGQLQRSEAAKGAEACVLEIPEGALQAWPVLRPLMEIEDAAALLASRREIVAGLKTQRWLPRDLVAALPLALRKDSAVLAAIDSDVRKLALAALASIDGELARLGYSAAAGGLPEDHVPTAEGE